MSHPIPTRIHCNNPEYHSEHMTRMMEDLQRAAHYNANQPLDARQKALEAAEDWLVKSEEHLQECTEKEGD